MCIICVELDKKRLSPWEAERNLTEMIEKIGENHARAVEEKIFDLKNQELNINFEEFSELQEESCEICGFNPCGCGWGFYDW